MVTGRSIFTRWPARPSPTSLPPLFGNYRASIYLRFVMTIIRLTRQRRSQKLHALRQESRRLAEVVQGFSHGKVIAERRRVDGPRWRALLRSDDRPGDRLLEQQALPPVRREKHRETRCQRGHLAIRIRLKGQPLDFTFLYVFPRTFLKFQTSPSGGDRCIEPTRGMGLDSGVSALHERHLTP